MRRGPQLAVSGGDQFISCFHARIPGIKLFGNSSRAEFHKMWPTRHVNQTLLASLIKIQIPALKLGPI